jgi:CheY-like chemotaxis protein
MCRTLIVDDDDDIRMLLRLGIERANNGLEVAGEADNGLDAIQRWRDTDPDVILLDHSMPGMTGMEVARVILGEQPDQAIIMFTAYTNSAELRSATDQGVRAVVDKKEWASVPDLIRKCSDS